MIPTTAIAGILTYAWPFAQDKSSLIAIAVIYGYVAGNWHCLDELTIQIFLHTDSSRGHTHHCWPDR